MTTVYIDSILYSPKDYNSMYNYNQYNPFENKQNNILDIINTTKKDDVITGDECFIYKNPDGTLKKMDINGISEMIYKKIEKQLSDYMGRVFEDICTQYLWKQLLAGNSPIEFVSLGRWWGNDSVNKCQTEIDIMGEQDNKTALFAECTWRNENVDLDVLEKLVDRSTLFRYSKVHYYLFSKTGFTNGCMEKAEEMGNVTLVSYKDIMGANE